MKKHHAILLALAIGAAGATATQAATLGLTGNAVGTSRQFDYFSDAFAQIDRGFNGNPALDGYFTISALPTFTQIGGGADVFPTESFLDLGTLTYNATGLLGVGVESRPITALTMNLDTSVDSNWGEYSTAITALTGTLTFTNGAVTNINLTSDITFTHTGSSPLAGLSYAGDFDIVNSAFTVNVDQSNVVQGVGDFRQSWQLTGSAAAVPEPGSAGLALLGATMLGLRRRRTVA